MFKMNYECPMKHTDKRTARSELRAPNCTRPSLLTQRDSRSAARATRHARCYYKLYCMRDSRSVRTRYTAHAVYLYNTVGRGSCLYHSITNTITAYQCSSTVLEYELKIGACWSQPAAIVFWTSVSFTKAGCLTM